MGERESHPRAGREASTDAMLAAAEMLFSQRGFAAVSVREIAHEAGFSHALVHRYLGSKDDIYRAVLRRNETLIRDAAGPTGDIDVALRLMMREGLRRHRPYLRIIVQSALSGQPFETTIGRFTATERLIEIAEERFAGSQKEDRDLTPRFVIAAIVSLYLGWAAIEPWILRATGLDDLDEESLLTGLEQVLIGIVNEQLGRAED